MPLTPIVPLPHLRRVVNHGVPDTYWVCEGAGFSFGAPSASDACKYWYRTYWRRIDDAVKRMSEIPVDAPGLAR